MWKKTLSPVSPASPASQRVNGNTHSIDLHWHIANSQSGGSNSSTESCRLLVKMLAEALSSIRPGKEDEASNGNPAAGSPETLRLAPAGVSSSSSISDTGATSTSVPITKSIASFKPAIHHRMFRINSRGWVGNRQIQMDQESRFMNLQHAEVSPFQRHKLYDFLFLLVFFGKIMT